jgi:hypothetical protein
LKLLADWYCEIPAQGAGALIFLEWMRQLTFRLAEDDLGPAIE